MSKVVACIPVRYGAQRFPGKPLAKILNKPMIEWVVEGVSQSQKIQRIIVATDDERIAEAVSGLSVDVVMTDSDLPSGTDRVWQAVEQGDEDCIINIQGDEPLIQGSLIDQMAEFMVSDSPWDMVTFGKPMTGEALESPNTAKIVTDQNSYALYFSRFPIPYSREKAKGDFSGCMKHIGIYGYRRSFLQKFCEHPVVDIEKNEGLEQLRALYLGAQFKVLKVDYESWGVDTPEDVAKVEEQLRKRNG